MINTLRKKAVCKVAPIPGETKVWQYITLFKRIFLIDCPGVVYPSGDSETDIVLKGVVRVESLQDPMQYVDEVLARVQPEYIQRTYGVSHWENSTDFLEQFARQRGKMLKGGEPDFNNVSRMVLHDWQRGRLPWFCKPAFEDELAAASKDNNAADSLRVVQMVDRIQAKADFIDADMQDGDAEDAVDAKRKRPAVIMTVEDADEEAAPAKRSRH